MHGKYVISSLAAVLALAAFLCLPACTYTREVSTSDQRVPGPPTPMGDAHAAYQKLAAANPPPAAPGKRAGMVLTVAPVIAGDDLVRRENRTEAGVAVSNQNRRAYRENSRDLGRERHYSEPARALIYEELGKRPWVEIRRMNNLDGVMQTGNSYPLDQVRRQGADYLVEGVLAHSGPPDSGEVTVRLQLLELRTGQAVASATASGRDLNEAGRLAVDRLMEEAWKLL